MNSCYITQIKIIFSILLLLIIKILILHLFHFLINQKLVINNNTHYMLNLQKMKIINKYNLEFQSLDPIKKKILIIK